MTIKQIKKELGITDKDIAEFFQYKNTASYSQSSAKPRIEAGIVAIVERVKLCECDYPLVRTSDIGEYCGLCEKDLD